ncbi:MAG: glucose-1-phosphate cytidylyltransferase [Bacteroidia bacterium]|nr:glucose-1-phosphate cytidylyltransferase [Bacteroidia bacterium]
MKVVILCGGRGTRIRDVSDVIPKPLLPIGPQPILWHIMKLYAHYGLKDFVLCLGYNGWKIKEYFLNFHAMTRDFTVTLDGASSVEFHSESEVVDWKVTLVDTGDQAMTGARLWNVRKYLKDEDAFCLTYGDGVADIDIAASIAFHRAHGKVATIAGVHPASRFGEIVLDGDTVTHFNEKPNIREGRINGGFMVFDGKRVWDYLWPEESLSLETEPLPAMAKDGQMASFRHDGFWQCMDTAREFKLLNDIWHEGKAPWKLWD